MMRRLGDDSYVAVPNDEVGRLGFGDALEAFCAVVEVVGIGIGVRKSGSLVNRMH